MKILVMSAYFNFHRSRVLWGALSFFYLSFCFTCLAFGTDRQPQTSRPRIVVLDPGHGGHNTGASGAEKLFEKHVVMEFARTLTEQLKDRYRVLLTRTDDYDVPLEDRIAKANHAQADLFISIHTGGSLLHKVGGISIFYYENPPVKELSPEASLSGSTGPKHLEPWEYVKPVHIERSRYFAELLKIQLMDDREDLKITLSGAPLVIAAGADMPTLLIEIGTLTNPKDAQSLNNTDILNSYAESILKAIDAFFSDTLHL
jgi:N-acetylmuramoyl-L-alanine amidase